MKNLWQNKGFAKQFEGIKCNIVKNEGLVFCELKLARERQLIIEQIGIFWAMPNLPLNYTRKKEEQSQESIWHQMVLLTVKAWKLYETLGDVTTPEISCQSFLYRHGFTCLSAAMFDFVLTLNFAFQIEKGINPACTSVGIMQNSRRKSRLKVRQAWCKPGLAQSQMLKHLMGLAWWRSRAHMTLRPSVVTGLVSDSTAFSFSAAVIMSSDIRSDL